MDKRAITKAESRLRLARSAFTDFSEAKEYEAFTDGWYSFIVAIKNVYTVLQQGAKITPQSRQWFGAKAAERRGDELLQYVYEARNDDEHGLEPITAKEEGSLAVGVNRPGFSKAVEITGIVIGPNGLESPLTVRSLDGRPVLIELTPDRFVLADIRPLGRPPMPPPKRHLGEELPDPSPMGVATLALAYMESLVAEAALRA